MLSNNIMSEGFKNCGICNSITTDNRRGGRCNVWSMSDLQGIFMIECGMMICNLCWNTRGTKCNECKSDYLKAVEQKNTKFKTPQTKRNNKMKIRK